MSEIKKKAVAKLRAIADMFRSPGTWTQGRYARDAEGNTCGIDNPKASCWCATGALMKVFTSEVEDEAYFAAYFAAKNSIRTTLADVYTEARGIESWNDQLDRKVEDVVELFEEAAKRLETTL